MLLGLAAKFTAVVGEDGLDRNADRLVERQHAVVEGVRRSDRHLAGVDLGESERTEGVDDNLDVDLADALEGASVESVLIQEFSGRGGLDVLRDDIAAGTFEQAHLFVGEDIGGVAGVD